jgi:hypothetical protein
MKKHLFTMILCAYTLTSLIFYSCSDGSTSSNQEPKTTSKEYTVHLGFGGEITNISTTPLTKVVDADTDLYGIQVYSCPAADSISPTYTYYATGLFNDKSDMTINLLQGYIYKFACTMVVDGKDKIWHYLTNNNEYYYSAPFNLSSGGTDTLNNKFIYSTTNCMNGLTDGFAYFYNNGSYTTKYRPNVDRYYGELTDFVPADNKSATISMKRVVFGAKFNAEGLTGGKLNISMKDAPDIYITYPDTTTQGIFTLENPNYYSNSMAWTGDNYSESISTSITWTKADGATVPLATQDITFKRNMLTTITVKVNDTSTKSGITLSTESTGMGDGGSVTINGSSSGSTTVNP